MNKFSLVYGIITVLTLTVSGCGTSPEAQFYTLNPVEKESESATGLQNLAVKVGPVTIPDTLDQSQIVTRAGKNRLVLDEFNRWGGDLQEDIQRVLGENIAALLPTDQVILYNDIALIPVDIQVVVHIREFDGELGGEVVLNADWNLLVNPGKDKTVTARKSVLRERTGAAHYEAYVAAQSRLLARLSEEIVTEIRSQQAR